MKNQKPLTTLVGKMEQALPQLSFTAYYEADNEMLRASMRSYRLRSFLYVLAIDLDGKEEYVYVGKTAFQYGRMLQHMTAFSFDRIYLFECHADALSHCEKEAIHLLRPLFNRRYNPSAVSFQRVLSIDYDGFHDREQTLRYLKIWREYRSLGLYGFSLPPVLYSLLKVEAESHGCTVSQEMTGILEALFSEDIASATERGTESQKTNLLTTEEYGSLHARSQEQVKQYLYQENRLAGLKVGRDWITIEDEAWPEDRRERTTIY